MCSLQQHTHCRNGLQSLPELPGTYLSSFVVNIWLDSPVSDYILPLDLTFLAVTPTPWRIYIVHCAGRPATGWFNTALRLSCSLTSGLISYYCCLASAQPPHIWSRLRRSGIEKQVTYCKSASTFESPFSWFGGSQKCLLSRESWLG